MAGRNKQKVVPGAQLALNALKYEIAAELGLSGDISSEFAAELGSIQTATAGMPNWGNISSREVGTLGGAMTSRLVQTAQKTLLSYK